MRDTTSVRLHRPHHRPPFSRQVHELLAQCLGAAEEAALSPYERVLLAVLRDDPFATIELLRADEAFGEGCRPLHAFPLPLTPDPRPFRLPPALYPQPLRPTLTTTPTPSIPTPTPTQVAGGSPVGPTLPRRPRAARP